MTTHWPPHFSMGNAGYFFRQFSSVCVLLRRNVAASASVMMSLGSTSRSRRNLRIPSLSRLIETSDRELGTQRSLRDGPGR